MDWVGLQLYPVMESGGDLGNLDFKATLFCL
jgi:hypothetical protein